MRRVMSSVVSGILASWLFIYPVCTLAYPQFTPQWTQVEQKFLALSMRQSVYPHEYIPIIEVRTQYELGKLTALRFIEWVQHNPNGVVGFTSGHTPEFFIKFLDYYKHNWHKPNVQEELHSVGIRLKNFPNTTNLKLVQLEEVYPLSERNYKKISNFTVRHYAKVLGIKPQNLLLMNVEKTGILAEKGMNVVFMNGKVDLSITNRKASSQLESWQQRAIKEVREFCVQYENKIRAWGGIGFYVGGISYVGQLGFNEPGGPVDSKTHIVGIDDRTAVFSAKDFGGIDYARGKIAITVGLGTITYNPNAVMIVIASGDAKAPVVRDAVENKVNLRHPATILQKYPNSRMYITDGATVLLDDRQTENLRVKSKHGWLQKHVEEIILHIALSERKQITQLTEKDLRKHLRGRLLLENPSKPLHTMLTETRSSLIKKIENGVKFNFARGSKILHTAPHHEDIILGYYPFFDSHAHKYKNSFAFVTSGYNCVTDNYVLTTLNRANDWWLDKEQDYIFKKPVEKVYERFKMFYSKQDVEQLNLIETILAMRNVVSIYNIKTMDELKQTIRWMKDEYFPNKQPGDLDITQIKLLKGMMRESEAERALILKGTSLLNIHHLRSKFYSGREFMRTPRFDADIMPLVNLYNKTLPDIVFVEDDPDSTPLITNYRVLQMITQGLRSRDSISNPNLQVIGYRTVWFKYRVSDANVFVPVSRHSMTVQKRMYNSCFNSQAMSLYPAPGQEEDAIAAAEKIQREQLADLKVLLGSNYFSKHQTPEIRDAVGFVFLNHFTLNDFFRRTDDLQSAIDLEESYINSVN